MRKSTLAGALAIAMGVACLLLFGWIGATIDRDGFIHEPFGLIPIGMLLIAIGAVVVILGFAGAYFRNAKG